MMLSATLRSIRDKLHHAHRKVRMNALYGLLTLVGYKLISEWAIGSDMTKPLARGKRQVTTVE
jgi:hypothetical protein